MLLLGGLQMLVGPLMDGFTFAWPHETVARTTDQWRTVLGTSMSALLTTLTRWLCQSENWKQPRRLLLLLQTT